MKEADARDRDSVVRMMIAPVVMEILEAIV